MKVEEGTLLWTPPASRVARSHLTRYLRWLAERGHTVDDYEALWRWSVADLEAFWGSMAEFCGLECSTPSRVLERAPRRVRVVSWRQAQLRAPRAAPRASGRGRCCISLSAGRWRPAGSSWRARCACSPRMRALGIAPGDRVCLPAEYPKAIIAVCDRSIGRVSSCGPACPRALDFSQLAPRLMFCVDGYSYGGKADRRAISG
jgi:acetoacetyl-CoA synthetase